MSCAIIAGLKDKRLSEVASYTMDNSTAIRNGTISTDLASFMQKHLQRSSSMNKTISNLTMVVIGSLLLSACAQKAQAQVPTKAPAPIAIEVSSPVPGVISQPLGQVTPETPPPFVTSNDGQIVVTRDVQGQTINLAVGQNFLLKLGNEYTWEITVSDETVLGRVKNIAVVSGAQGVYEALHAGSVQFSASGDPLCRQSRPACGKPSIQLEFTVNVK
jgi:hypothetical protein